MEINGHVMIRHKIRENRFRWEYDVRRHKKVFCDIYQKRVG